MELNTNNALIGKIFRITIISFFAANIMTVLGSVIDGFIVGNTMDEHSVAASGLVAPAIIIYAFIGTAAAISFQVRSLNCLNRGDTDGARRALTETLMTALGLSFIVMAVTLHSPEIIVRVMGVTERSPSFQACTDYLRGMVTGLPAMTAMAILTRGVQIDGHHRISYLTALAVE